MQFVVFVSDKVLSDVLVSKLNLLFDDFRIVNIDQKFSVFELEQDFRNNKIYFLDLVNSRKSRDLIAFVLSQKTETCYNLDYFNRTNYHFKYSGKFFNLLNLKSLKSITSNEILIYNRSKEHTIDLLKGYPIIFDTFNSDNSKEIACDETSFNNLYQKFFALNENFILLENHNPDEFLECVIQDNTPIYLYDDSKILNFSDIDPKVFKDLQIFAKQIPKGILTCKLVKLQDDYAFANFCFGLNAKFFTLYDIANIQNILNLKSL